MDDLKNAFAQALILSYSYSGNTHRIARQLQALTGADWREIYPRQPYPVPFPELLEQVRREINTGFRPQLLPGAPCPRPYSILLVGSPNWCGTIAPPLAAWLCQNDFSGKTLLPFYSHCGGLAGDLRRDIQTLCPQAEVRPPLAVLQDGGSSLDKTLLQWLWQTIQI